MGGGRPLIRQHLTRWLEEGARRRLTLVCAPAGFGKTTLLAQWARASGMPVAWLALDEGDDDPARFWRYFFAALGTQGSDALEDASALFMSGGGSRRRCWTSSSTTCWRNTQRIVRSFWTTPSDRLRGDTPQPLVRRRTSARH